MNNMLTVEEVKHYLEIEQETLETFIQQGKLHAYKIGGTYLRFRKEEVLNLRFEVRPSQKSKITTPSIFHKIGDFWRFNNFYIISLMVIVALVVVIIRT